MNPSTVKYLKTQVEDFNIFYREAGPKEGPVVLLLHGYPTSSHMYRNLIPILSEKYHVVAPDLIVLVFLMLHITNLSTTPLTT